MKKKEKLENTIVDFAKIFFAICIVFIHTNLYTKIIYGLYIKEIVFRVGILYFFICSGYFFAKSKSKENYNFKETIKHYLTPYLFWGLVYMLLHAFLKTSNPLLYLKSNFIKYLIFLPPCTNIMWYSGSLIISFFILDKIKNKRILIMSVILAFVFYIIGLSFTSYDFVLNNINSDILNKLINVFGDNRNVLFVGYLYTAIGYLIYGLKNTNIKKVSILLIDSLIMLFIESYCVINNVMGYSYDYLLFHLPFTALLFIITLNIPFKKDTKKIRCLSANMYYTQYIFIYVASYILNRTQWGREFINIIYYDLCIITCVIVFCIIINIIPNLKIKRLIFSC